jgi:hypothetical protein
MRRCVDALMRFRMRFAHIPVFCRQSRRGAKRRLQQICREATPLKAVSRRQRIRPSARLPSDSLTVLQSLRFALLPPIFLDRKTQLYYNNSVIPNRGIAQLVAHLLWEQGVASSSPATPTKIQCLSSSAGQSNRLLSGGSGVRIPPGTPKNSQDTARCLFFLKNILNLFPKTASIAENDDLLIGNDIQKSLVGLFLRC